MVKKVSWGVNYYGNSFILEKILSCLWVWVMCFWELLLGTVILLNSHCIILEMIWVLFIYIGSTFMYSPTFHPSVVMDFYYIYWWK